MRIALVTDTYVPQVNGVSTVLRRMVEALDAARHDAVVVAPEYPGQHREDPGEVRIPSMAFPPYPAIRLAWPAARLVSASLDRFRAQLVHVVTEGPLGLVGRHYARARRLPLVTSYHTHFPRYCAHYGVPGLEPAAWYFLQWFHGAAALTHTPGEAARRELIEHGIRHAVVWGRGVDTRHFHHGRRSAALRRRLGVREDRALVLHVGRLAPEKNLEILIGAWSIAWDALGERAAFVVAGEGPLRERLQARLPWATHLGFLDRAALAELYASADLCVLPSETETCGLVALEAMASGLPVVAASAGGLRESVTHGRTGLLAPPDDARAFAAAITALVMDPALRARLSAAARLTAVARDAAIEDAVLLDQYAELLGREPERDVWRAAS